MAIGGIEMTAHYSDFHLQPIAGEWREGSSERTTDVSNPYDGSTLLTTRLANREDLDAAFTQAEKAQAEWAATPPVERAGLMHRVIEIFDARKEEIIDWLIRESGSTRLKANVEWGAARGITQEAASMPGRVHGMTMDSNVSGKENRIYRKPLGVVGVISPWNFPLHLSQRSIAPRWRWVMQSSLSPPAIRRLPVDYC
ncbi:hypothetical protein HSBAA_61460 [Vreelandella sulfidaeris]|uniref:Aldehyde dehydrogenase domain-containing protein n=1 Tax=Vreelandella sulfidaeris TaxID=115553 RepID=A0A455UF57_9GAMM|nr:hypothetical protein HSBAA_61460 [Halomonas sulfidaeris]